MGHWAVNVFWNDDSMRLEHFRPFAVTSSAILLKCRVHHNYGAIMAQRLRARYSGGVQDRISRDG